MKTFYMITGKSNQINTQTMYRIIANTKEEAIDMFMRKHIKTPTSTSITYFEAPVPHEVTVNCNIEYEVSE
jgi:hypothetical protein